MSFGTSLKSNERTYMGSIPNYTLPRLNTTNIQQRNAKNKFSNMKSMFESHMTSFEHALHV